MRIPELVALMTNPLLGFTGGATFTPMSALSRSAPPSELDWTSAAPKSTPASGAGSRSARGGDTAGWGSAEGSADGAGALLDQYIRKRAVVSFSIPQLGARLGGGAAQFTFEVETAYRLISPVEPGYLTDSSG